MQFNILVDTYFYIFYKKVFIFIYVIKIINLEFMSS